MDRERWQQVDRICAFALRRQHDERAAFLDSECGDDEELRKEVDSIIAHAQAGDFLERTAAAEAARLVAGIPGSSLVGHAIDAYKILKPLGVGGMGEIYLARDARLNRPVALKLLSAHFTKEEDRVRRFRQEALAASAVNHPNILTIHEVGEWNGRNYIATEYVDERDETLAWLERGYLEREPRMVFLRAEPKWNNLRGDPRFQDLLRRVGFTN
jgi:serine/threonine protein kinase